MTRDDWQRWRDDPVTRAVIEAHLATAEANKAAWVAASWENGVASQANLIELRARSQAYLAIPEMTYEDLCQTLGVEPRDE